MNDKIRMPDSTSLVIFSEKDLASNEFNIEYHQGGGVKAQCWINSLKQDISRSGLSLDHLQETANDRNEFKRTSKLFESLKSQNTKHAMESSLRTPLTTSNIHRVWSSFCNSAKVNSSNINYLPCKNFKYITNNIILAINFYLCI